MLVKELKKLLDKVPDHLSVAFTLELARDIPAYIEVQGDDFFVNETYGYLEINSNIDEEALDELEEILQTTDVYDGALIYTKSDRFKSVEERMIQRGLSVVQN